MNSAQVSCLLNMYSVCLFDDENQRMAIWMEMNFNKLWRQKKQKPSILPSITRHLLDHHYHKGKNAGMLIAQRRMPPLLLRLCGCSLTLWAPQPAENSCPGDISISFKKSRMSTAPKALWQPLFLRCGFPQECIGLPDGHLYSKSRIMSQENIYWVRKTFLSQENIS